MKTDEWDWKEFWTAVKIGAAFVGLLSTFAISVLDDGLKPKDDSVITEDNKDASLLDEM